MVGGGARERLARNHSRLSMQSQDPCRQSYPVAPSVSAIDMQSPRPLDDRVLEEEPKSMGGGLERRMLSTSAKSDSSLEIIETLPGQRLEESQNCEVQPEFKVADGTS